MMQPNCESGNLSIKISTVFSDWKCSPPSQAEVVQHCLLINKFNWRYWGPNLGLSKRKSPTHIRTSQPVISHKMVSRKLPSILLQSAIQGNNEQVKFSSPLFAQYYRWQVTNWFHGHYDKLPLDKLSCLSKYALLSFTLPIATWNYKPICCLLFTFSSLCLLLCSPI